MMAQAVDVTVEILREPLAVASAAFPPFGDIFIVGSGAIAKLASRTEAILRAAAPFKSITVLPGLEGIEVPKGAAVLCLSDLVSPVFRDMNQKRFRGLQNVMETAETVLWVISGAKSGQDPDANMTVGLSSTLRAELMDLRLQFLDVDDPSSVDPSLVAKMLLRLAFLDPFKTDELLWTQEPELALKEGALYIPRVLSLDNIDRRSAARRWQVTQITSLASERSAVVLDDSQGGFELQAISLAVARRDQVCLGLQLLLFTL